MRKDHFLQWIGRELSKLCLDIGSEESKEVLNINEPSGVY